MSRTSAVLVAMICINAFRPRQCHLDCDQSGAWGMRWQLGRALFWTTVVLVAASLILALAGEEASSPEFRARALHWHEWCGLLSLPTVVAAIVVRCREPRHLLPMPHWLPHIRRGLEIALYVLLLLQPLSGWLLAGHEGKLTSFFGWRLPPLASPSGRLAVYGLVYHGLGGALILAIVALSLRVNLTALVWSLIPFGRRRHR
jgi:cytochrome b561